MAKKIYNKPSNLNVKQRGKYSRTLLLCSLVCLIAFFVTVYYTYNDCYIRLNGESYKAKIVKIDRSKGNLFAIVSLEGKEYGGWFHWR